MPDEFLPIYVEKMTKTAIAQKQRAAIPVVAVVYDGLCTFEYGIAAEIFGLSRPELGNDLYRFSSVAVENKTMRAAGGLTIKATGTRSDLESAHTIVIPGWRGKDEPVPEMICKQLRKAHHRGARLMSICSGSYVLAAAGLLEQRRVTTHWRYAKDMKSKFPDIVLQEDRLYVDEGDIITSAGSSAGIDACLHIVRCDYGAKIANIVARRLVIHAHRQGNQTQFIDQPIPKSAEDERLAGLMQEISNNLSAPHSISSMTKSVGMSSRTFQRRFVAFTGMAPMKWLAQERVHRCCQLLESTDLSIDRISLAVGFGGADILRYHFRETLSVSPNEYRKRFSTQI